MQQVNLKEALGHLATLPHFFVWRLSDRDATGKYKTKLPWAGGAFDAKGARLSGQLMGFDAAASAVASMGAAGGDVCYALGYYFMPEDGYWFLDIDSNADASAAKDAWAELAGVMFEYSSSGQGVHFIGRWPAPVMHGTRPDVGIELYSGERGICFGLHGVAWGCADVVMHPPARWVKAAAVLDMAPACRLECWHGPENDDELIQRMLNRREGATMLRGGKTFRQLWEGVEGEGDDDRKSELDAALASQLAWWTGCDQPRMLRLMMRSQRVRDKWLERDDYLQRTVKAACEWLMGPGGGRCFGWQPQLPPVLPAVIEVSPVMQFPEGMGVEARAVAAEFGVADTEELRGMAGATLALRTAGTSDELKAAAARVAGMQEWDAVDFEQLAQALQRKSSELQGKLPIKLCRDMLANTVGYGQEAAPPVAGAVGAPDWLGDWCFIKGEAKFCHIPRGYLPVTLATFDIVNAMCDGVPAKANGMPGKPSELWPVWRGENVDALGFDPRETQYYEYAGRRYCNTFVGSMPERDYAPIDAQARAAYMQHLRNLCNGDEAVYQVVLQWMARIVQLPGQIPRWAIMMIGNEGTGKTMLLNALQAAIGPSNVQVSGAKAVNNGGGFMDWAAAGKLLGVLNDFVIAGPDMYETAEAIKPVISDDLVSITRKGKADFVYHNFAGYFASANSNSPLPLTKGSRRWYITRTTFMDHFILDKDAASDYFEHLVDVMARVTPGQWRVFFESVQIADFPNRAPWSAEFDNVIANSTSEAKLAVMELIGDHKIVSGNQVGITLRGIDGAPSTTGVRRLLQELGFNCWKERVKIGGSAYTVYVHKSIGNHMPDALIKQSARQFSLTKDKERFATLQPGLQPS